MILSQEQINNYINQLDTHKQHIYKDALDKNNCKFWSDNYNERYIKNCVVKIIVEIPEFSQIKENYYGILISCYSNELTAFLAYTDLGRSGYNLVSFSYDESLDHMINTALKCVKTCDFCNEEVGLENLQPVGFANKSCTKCYPDAKRKLEYPGWYN